MRLCLIGKYPPIQGGVSQTNFWSSRCLADKGFEVHVITNASEVEDSFRVVDLDDWLPEPRATPPPGNRVIVHDTAPSVDLAYIPWANPFVTKLATLATRVVREVNCDLILGHYLEPYGMAAHLASQWTGISYGIGHAGSDVGRLFQSQQLQTGYREIIGRADFVLATGSTARAFRALGVDGDRIYPALSPGFPTAYFHPNAPPLDIGAALRAAVSRMPDSPVSRGVHRLADKPFNPELPTIGMYGKIGAVKGTYELVHALGKLRARGSQFNFVALIQGRPGSMRSILEAIDAARIDSCSFMLPFIPHWRVAGFIRSCSAVCFLERDFPIAVHLPSIPHEVLACGTCLVLSPEILNKQRPPVQLRPSVNVLVADPRDTASLLDALTLVVQEPERAKDIGRRGNEALVRRNEAVEDADRLGGVFRKILADTAIRRKMMSVADMQAALARLCATSSFRRLFELEPDATLDKYKLDPGEREALRNIDLKLLNLFAESLKGKRLSELRSAYPLVFRRLPAEELKRYYDRYYEMRPAFPGETQILSIDRFGRFLEESLATDSDVPFYAADLVRYERLLYSASQAIRREDGFETINEHEVREATAITQDSRPRLADGVQLGLFSCDIVRVIKQLDAGIDVESAGEGSYAYVFARIGKMSRPEVFRVNVPMYFLLECCDGRTSPADLVVECTRQFSGEASQDELTRVLTDLAARRLIKSAH